MKQVVEVHEELRGRLRAIALSCAELQVDERDDAHRALSALAQQLRSVHSGQAPGEIDGLAAARRLYREFGLDPTRTRPSSEALLRRALRGLALPRVNNVVDAGNLVSLSALLPLGLYDAERLVGPRIVLRLGGSGEGFEGIRKGWVNVTDRLCVADGEGACGSPTSDSLRTSIRADTRGVLAILFAPADCDIARLRSAAQILASALVQYAGARAGTPIELG